ncbi:MAG: M15 family metallopeptidase [Candidatus Tumulicola sp.]
MKRLAAIGLLCALALCRAATQAGVPPLPAGFVYLSDGSPTIVQDIRYAGAHNLAGRPLPGYLAPACVLTAPAARALAKAQAELEPAGLTLRVYDCYQPQRAAKALLAWSRNAADQRLKAEYYPRVEKSQLFKLGYLSVQSAHARGSSVDISVQRLSSASPSPWVPGERSCIAPFMARYHDGSIDMGSIYDCMDPISRADTSVGAVADTHRVMLRELMEKYGFKQSANLWWSFTLASEPFPRTFFDFPIRKR